MVEMSSMAKEPLPMAKAKRNVVSTSDAKLPEAGYEPIRRHSEKGLARLHPKSKMNVHHIVQFLPVSQLCRKQRIERNLSLREVGSKIDVHYYELHVIEQFSLREINLEILLKYIGFLGIEKEFEEWSQNNAEIIEAIGSV